MATGPLGATEESVGRPAPVTSSVVRANGAIRPVVTEIVRALVDPLVMVVARSVTATGPSATVTVVRRGAVTAMSRAGLPGGTGLAVLTVRVVMGIVRSVRTVRLVMGIVRSVRLVMGIVRSVRTAPLVMATVRSVRTAPLATETDRTVPTDRTALPAMVIARVATETALRSAEDRTGRVATGRSVTVTVRSVAVPTATAVAGTTASASATAAVTPAPASAKVRATTGRTVTRTARSPSARVTRTRRSPRRSTRATSTRSPAPS